MTIQYKTQKINVLLTPLQWRLVKILEKHPKGLIRGQNHEKRSLMKLLNRARTTVYDNLVKLQKLKIIEVSTRKTSGRGRPIKVWKLIN